jgi:ABC-type branched-subunit amino acid transport system permease subunit
MRHQCGEGSDGHVIAVVSDLGGILVLCGGHDLGSGLAILVRDRTLRVAIIRLVLGTSSVLDVVMIVLFTLHDAVDGAQGAVLPVVVQVTSKLPLFVLAMALVDIAMSVAAASVLVEVGAQVRALHDVHPGLVYLLLDGGELSMRRSIRLTTRLPARRRCRRLGHYTPLFH